MTPDVYADLVAVDTETEPIRRDAVPALVVVSTASAAETTVEFAVTEEQRAHVRARLLAAPALVFHHAAFDLAVLEAAGVLTRAEIAERVRAGRVHDTMILDQLLRLAEGGEGAVHDLPYFSRTYDGTLPPRSLAALAKEFLGVELDKRAEIRLGFADARERGFLLPEEKEYAAQDAEVTRRLALVLLPRAGAYGEELLTEAIQIGGALALAEIGRRGLRLDVEAARRARVEEEARREEAARVLRELGYLVTVGKKRPREKLDEKRLRTELLRLASEMGISPRLTLRGLMSLRSEDWKEFRGRHPVIDALLDYKRAEKRIQAFLRNWIRTAGEDDVVRPTYRPLVTTGRAACANPNLQQVPRRGAGALTRVFVPDPGRVLWELDYRALELVCLAQVLVREFGRSALADALNAGVDVHRVVASRIYGKPAEELTKDERFVAKCANFGFAAGMGAKTFVRHLRRLAGIAMSEEEAARIRAAWMDTFPEMREYLALYPKTNVAARLGLPPHWNRELEYWLRGEPTRLTASQIGAARRAVESFLASGGPIAEVLLKRFARDERDRALADWIRDVSVCTLTGRTRRPVGYTEFHNSKFQGLAADGAKRALFRLWSERIDVRAFVHDSVLIETEPGEAGEHEAERARQILIEEMHVVVPDVVVEVEVRGPLLTWE